MGVCVALLIFIQVIKSHGNLGGFFFFDVEILDATFTQQIVEFEQVFSLQVHFNRILLSVVVKFESADVLFS